MHAAIRRPMLPPNLSLICQTPGRHKKWQHQLYYGKTLIRAQQHSGAPGVYASGEDGGYTLEFLIGPWGGVV